MWHEFRANRTRYIHQLHKHYGSTVVRIAPNEVAFASADAVKDIYCSGGSGYDKTEFYDLFKVYGRRTMFTTLNKEDVSPHRIPVSGHKMGPPLTTGSLRRAACQAEEDPRRPIRQQ